MSKRPIPGRSLWRRNTARDLGVVLTASRLIPPLTGLALGLLILGPALRPGFVLSYDMVFVPDPPPTAAMFGGTGGFPRQVPSDAFAAALSFLPFSQQLILLSIFVLAAWGMGRLIPGSLPAIVLYLWNPYVAERLLLGHWALLLGYAGLPWVLDAVLRRRHRALAVALLPAAIGGFAAMNITALVLAGGLVATRGRGALRVLLTFLLMALPWLVPALLNATETRTDPLGVDLFAARADTPFGTLGSLLSLGGIWNAETVPSGLSPFLPSLLRLLLSLAALATTATLAFRTSPTAQATLFSGLLGLTLASLGTTPLGRSLLHTLITLSPAFGPLRDAHLYTAPLALTLSLGLAHLSTPAPAPAPGPTEPITTGPDAATEGTEAIATGPDADMRTTKPIAAKSRPNAETTKTVTARPNASTKPAGISTTGPDIETRSTDTTASNPNPSVTDAKVVTAEPDVGTKGTGNNAARANTDARNAEIVTAGTGVDVRDAETVAAGAGVDVKDAGIVTAGPGVDVKDTETVAAGPNTGTEPAGVSATGPDIEAKSTDTTASDPNTDVTDAKVVTAEPDVDTKGTGNNAARANTDARNAEIVTAGTGVDVKDAEVVAAGTDAGAKSTGNGAARANTSARDTRIVATGPSVDVKDTETVAAGPNASTEPAGISTTGPNIETRSTDTTASNPNTGVRDAKVVTAEPNVGTKGTGNNVAGANADVRDAEVVGAGTDACVKEVEVVGAGAGGSVGGVGAGREVGGASRFSAVAGKGLRDGVEGVGGGLAGVGGWSVGGGVRKGWRGVVGVGREVRGVGGGWVALVPVLLLPTLAWGVTGRLEAVEYPADWRAAQRMINADPVGGKVLSLPWGAYRRPAWNGGRAVLDPWPRMVGRRVVWNDGLRVGDRSLAQEDPLAIRADRILRRTGDLTDSLRAEGFRYVVISKDGSETSWRARLKTAGIVLDGPTLLVYLVDQPD